MLKHEATAFGQLEVYHMHQCVGSKFHVIDVRTWPNCWLKKIRGSSNSLGVISGPLEFCCDVEMSNDLILITKVSIAYLLLCCSV